MHSSVAVDFSVDVFNCWVLCVRVGGGVLRRWVCSGDGPLQSYTKEVYFTAFSLQSGDLRLSACKSEFL